MTVVKNCVSERDGCYRNPSLTRHSLSFISHPPVISRKPLLGHVFWGCCISRWGFSTHMSAYEKWAVQVPKCFALVMLEGKQSSRSTSCRSGNDLLRWLLIAVALRKWTWHFPPFPSHEMNMVTNRPYRVVRSYSVGILCFHLQLIWGMHISYFHL